MLTSNYYIIRKPKFEPQNQEIQYIVIIFWNHRLSLVTFWKIVFYNKFINKSMNIIKNIVKRSEILFLKKWPKWINGFESLIKIDWIQNLIEFPCFLAQIFVFCLSFQYSICNDNVISFFIKVPQMKPTIDQLCNSQGCDQMCCNLNKIHYTKTIYFYIQF